MATFSFIQIFNILCKFLTFCSNFLNFIQILVILFKSTIMCLELPSLFIMPDITTEEITARQALSQLQKTSFKSKNKTQLQQNATEF